MNSNRSNYKITMYACFIGYIVQAIVNNFAPLLFVTFQNSYDIPLSKITILITINFLIQLVVDVLSAGFIDKIGYRASAIIAHICAALGLICLVILPEIMSDAYLGILISVVVYAIGGGLIEVIISPMMEACPTKNKEKMMSLLHSFYCIGHVCVILISTGFFALFGLENWRILAFIWAIVPIVNILLFVKAPIYSLCDEGESGLKLTELFRKKLFWLLLLMMLCAGASEQAVSQWASVFAEKGLQISKTLGDLAGPMSFAIFMGLSRLIYGKYGDKFDLDRFMKYSCILCIASYCLISLIPDPIIGLVGCAICGFSVGILWPGTYSIAAVSIKNGGTAMFAMLAFAGDLGCSAGPTLAGFVSGRSGGDFRTGIFSAVAFPAILLIGVFLTQRSSRRSK